MRRTQRVARRKRACIFCSQKIEIDYKNYQLLKKFTTERGKIQPRITTALCPLHQRKLAQAIKRARILALLPFVSI